MTETDSNITRDKLVIAKGHESYNAGSRDDDSITRSYRREREGVGTIGLD